jgi:hypothetical protein
MHRRPVLVALLTGVAAVVLSAAGLAAPASASPTCLDDLNGNTGNGASAGISGSTGAAEQAWHLPKV